MPYTLDKPVTEYSISALLGLYNDICRYNGVPGRNSTFRDKAAAVKAVQGALVQANTPEPEVKASAEEHAAFDQENPDAVQFYPEPATSPGLSRLRSSPSANALRASVLADQVAAAEVAGNRATEPVADVTDPTVEVPATAKRGRSSSLSGSEKITLLVSTNPKRAGSTAHDWFKKYVDGQTVDQYAAACRNRSKAIRHVMWDVKKGFIRLT